jgi:hypothetical protein
MGLDLGRWRNLAVHWGGQGSRRADYSEVISSLTFDSIRFRTSLNWSDDISLGSGICQSTRCLASTRGHSSPHPMVTATSTSVPLKSFSPFEVCLVKSYPNSFIASIHPSRGTRTSTVRFYLAITMHSGKGLSHLAPVAVLYADKKNAFLHGLVISFRIHADVP